MKKKNLATLNADQERAYGLHFSYYLNNVRKDNKRADAYAWKKLCEDWMELKQYRGAKP